MATYTWVDYVIILIFSLSILAGFGRGFIKEAISLITLIAAFVVAIMFSIQILLRNFVLVKWTLVVYRSPKYDTIKI